MNSPSIRTHYSPLFACDDCTFVNQCIAMQTAGLSALFFRRRAYTVALSCRPVLPPLKRAALLTPPRVAFSGGVFLRAAPICKKAMQPASPASAVSPPDGGRRH
jgi:hypothetical protein